MKRKWSWIFQPWIMLLPAWCVFYIFERMKLAPFQWNNEKAWRISDKWILVKHPAKKGENTK